MRTARNIFLSICIIVPVSAAFGQDGAGQDIKAAGGSAKTAVVKTGSAAGKATVKGLSRSASKRQRPVVAPPPHCPEPPLRQCWRRAGGCVEKDSQGR